MPIALVFTHRWPLLQIETEHQEVEYQGAVTNVPAPRGAFIYSEGCWYHRLVIEKNWRKTITTNKLDDHRVPKELRTWALLLK
jgi:hypothetical protein